MATSPLRSHTNEHGPLTPDNPSRTATARVKDALPLPTTCPHCASEVRLTTEKAIYGTTYSDWPWVYACTACDARVGLHPFTSIPLGTLADKETRAARTRAKAAFNCIWQGKHLSRNEAYAWLASDMGIPVGECHIGWFDALQCDAAIKATARFFKAKRMATHHAWTDCDDGS